LYSFLIIVIIIFIPIPIMTRYMLAGRSAYQGVFQGTVTAVTGIALLLLLSWALTGISVFDAMNQILNNVSVDSIGLAKNYESLGLRGMSLEEMQASMDQMKEITKLSVPGTLIIIASVLAYVNYGILSRILRKFNGRVSVLPPFRAFTLPKSIIIGSIMIYGLSFIVINMGIINRELMMLTVQIVFTFIFSVQGLAVIFFFWYIKRFFKVILIVLSAVLIFTWFGQTILFMLGLLDVVLDLRKRFSQTILK